MKKAIKILAGISAAAVAGTALYAGSLYSSAKKQVKNLPDGFTVTAHTGCEGTKDNSVESVIAGSIAGADIVEFDLRFNSEGKGILSHDAGAENPVTLEEAFNLISTYNYLKVNVDCKTTDNLKAVYRLSEEKGITDRIFYTGIEEKDVDAAKEQTPEIPYFLNYSVSSSNKGDKDYAKYLTYFVKEKGAVGINMRYSQCSKVFVDTFRKEGLAVSLWTANDIVSMLKCIALAPDNITTRHPSTLIKLINKLRD